MILENKIYISIGQYVCKNLKIDINLTNKHFFRRIACQISKNCSYVLYFRDNLLIKDR